MFRFGVPLAVGSFAQFVAGKWNNLLVSRFFGPAVVTAAGHGVQRRRHGVRARGGRGPRRRHPTLPGMEAANALRRCSTGTSLIALVSMPLCFGPAAVSLTLVSTLFHPRWATVAPMLSVLSALMAMAAMVGLILAYLEARDHSRLVMSVQILRCSRSSVWRRRRGIELFLDVRSSRPRKGSFVSRARSSSARSIECRYRECCRPSSAPFARVRMVGAVLGAGSSLSVQPSIGMHHNLAVETALGAVAYVGAASLVCRPVVRASWPHAEIVSWPSRSGADCRGSVSRLRARCHATPGWHALDVLSFAGGLYAGRDCRDWMPFSWKGRGSPGFLASAEWRRGCDKRDSVQLDLLAATSTLGPRSR